MSLPLFEHLAEIRQRTSGKPVLLCLDYDGTLVPIAVEPRLARLDDSVRVLLQQASCLVPVAIVSGRSLDEVKRLVGLQGLIYAGNHGLEIASNGFQFVADLPDDWRKRILDLAAGLGPVLAEFKGAWLEDKGLTLSIHYRRIAPESVSGFQARVREVVSPLIEEGQVRMTSGKAVFEIRPPTDWDKGKAVRYLLSRPELCGRVPIYIGDDETDEHVFREIGESGITIHVGADDDYVGRARYRVRHTGDVQAFIGFLVQAWSTAKR